MLGEIRAYLGTVVPRAKRQLLVTRVNDRRITYRLHNKVKVLPQARPRRPQRSPAASRDDAMTRQAGGLLVE